jgi:hypothetical protein
MYQENGNVKTYQDFLSEKVVSAQPMGFDVELSALNPSLFDWQKVVVQWALKRGRAALFEACGLGKTLQQCEWARLIHELTGGDVLILAPLAVSSQTVREGAKFGIAVNKCRKQSDVRPGVNIANYEMLEHFDASHFAGVVLDESSILKGFTGKMRNQICAAFANTPYRLACTATPAPNDHMELGNHSEFLGIMPNVNMLSTWFVNDGFEAGKWRLKGHAAADFWRWVSTWAVCLSKPSDMGFDDAGYKLPELRTIKHHVGDEFECKGGQLIRTHAPSATDLGRELRATIDIRADKTAEIVAATDGPVLIWVNLNDEAESVLARIPEAKQITGSMSTDAKEQVISDFVEGRLRVLIGKPSICGFGMNFQHCADMVFMGLSYSFEQRYQAVRRCWRFGQTRPVNDHVVMSASEAKIFEKVHQKELKHMEMEQEMSVDVALTHEARNQSQGMEYQRREVRGKDWTVVNGDSCKEILNVESDSMGFSIFSPPFSSLFVYSDSIRDMGNCESDEQFFQHFAFLVPELLRITMPGRLCAVHCSQIPAHKWKDGEMGLKDFRGDIIRTFQAAGWVYHSEVCIWKDPVVEMQRTKALGLLHKQIKKNSAMSRVGMPDYLVVFRKPGDPVKPVARPNGFNPAAYIGEDGADCKTSIDVWQRYASPVWHDINQTNVLNVRVARAEKDERHLCPLQLDVIERAIHLWTIPGDTVFTPFLGIGSEVYSAVKLGRKGYGIELKPEYFNQAVQNIKTLDADKRHLSLLSLMQSEVA